MCESDLLVKLVGEWESGTGKTSKSVISSKVPLKTMDTMKVIPQKVLTMGKVSPSTMPTKHYKLGGL